MSFGNPYGQGYGHGHGPGAPGGYGAGGYGAGPYGAGLPPGGTAAVWPWYIAYAIFMAVVYLACFAGGIALVAYADAIGPGAAPDEDPIVMGGILTVVGLPFLLAYGAAPLLPKKPWAWTFHLVLICIGMTSACCALACIPLLIGWLKPECKAMFGKT